MNMPSERLQQPPRDILQRLRRRYARALTHVALASRDSDAALSEQQIWHLLASRLSAQWAAAYGALQTSQMRLSRLYCNENKPLGPIGAALECEDTLYAEDAQRAALAQFTLIDERLRTKKFLSLLVQNLILEQR